MCSPCVAEPSDVFNLKLLCNDDASLHQEGHTDIACPLWDIQCPIRTFHVVKGHIMRCVGMVCLAIVDIPCAEK